MPHTAPVVRTPGAALRPEGGSPGGAGLRLRRAWCPQLRFAHGDLRTPPNVAPIVDEWTSAEWMGAGTVPVGDPSVDGLGDGVGRAVLREGAQGGAGFVHRLQGCSPEVFEGRVSVLGVDAGGELVRRHELQLG